MRQPTLHTQVNSRVEQQQALRHHQLLLGTAPMQPCCPPLATAPTPQCMQSQPGWAAVWVVAAVRQQMSSAAGSGQAQQQAWEAAALQQQQPAAATCSRKSVACQACGVAGEACDV